MARTAPTSTQTTRPETLADETAFGSASGITTVADDHPAPDGRSADCPPDAGTVLGLDDSK